MDYPVDYSEASNEWVERQVRRLEESLARAVHTPDTEVMICEDLEMLRQMKALRASRRCRGLWGTAPGVQAWNLTRSLLRRLPLRPEEVLHGLSSRLPARADGRSSVTNVNE